MVWEVPYGICSSEDYGRRPGQGKVCVWAVTICYCLLVVEIFRSVDAGAGSCLFVLRDKV